MSSIFLRVVPSPTIVRSDIVTPGYFSDLMNYYSLYSSDSVILLFCSAIPLRVKVRDSGSSPTAIRRTRPAPSLISTDTRGRKTITVFYKFLSSEKSRKLPSLTLKSSKQIYSLSILPLLK